MARVARVTAEPVWAWTLSMHTYARDLVAGDLTAAAAAAESSREYAGGFRGRRSQRGVWGLQIYLVQRELDALEAARPFLADTGKRPASGRPPPWHWLPSSDDRPGRTPTRPDPRR